LLTGLYPPRHGVRDNGRYHLAADGARTLAEQLRDAGYSTAACVGCFVLDRRFGLDRGFEFYDFRVTASGYLPLKPDFNERGARAVTDAALTWLQHRDDRPFFLWVHYFDPHRPYRSPLQNQPEFHDRPYDAEIAHVDAQLGRLLAHLDAAGLRDHTLIVVVGDHGESLGEHGEPSHGLFLYDSTMRVPLILAGSGLFDQPWRLGDRQVSLVDLRPTLEDLLGLPHHEPCDGVSLFAAVDPERAVYLETELPLGLAGWSPLYGLRTLDEKYVQAPVPESYDLRDDARELRNRREMDSRAGADLQHRLAELMDGWGEAVHSRRAITETEARRLASLGYVQGAGHAPATRPDPKLMLPIHLQTIRAEQLYVAGNYTEAVALAGQVVRDCPDYDAAVRILAFGRGRLGHGDEAVDLMRRAFERRPGQYLARGLAQILIAEGRFAEAETVLDRYAELAPQDGRVALLRGDIRAREGRIEEARVFYQEARDLDVNRVGPRARERLHRLDGEL